MISAIILFTAWTASTALAQTDLSGQVTDDAGKPIAQAAVFIYTAKPRVGQGILCPSCYADCRKKAATDAEGKFLISDLDPELLFKVLIVAEGFHPQFAKDVDPAQNPLQVKLEAMPGNLSNRAVLRGRVLDGAGKPVVGAVVSPWGCERIEKRWWGALKGVDPACITNLNGEFLITGNPGDQGYDLEIEARGFAKLKVPLLPTGDKIHEIQLTEGVMVVGRILMEGKPLAGMPIGLVQSNRGSSHFIGAYAATTDPEGRFTFNNVHPNDEYICYTSMQDAGRFGGILTPVQVALGKDGTIQDMGDCNLTTQTYKLAGRIILTDDKPIPPNSRLLLTRNEAWDSQTTEVAADGSFTFAGVPEEAMTLNAKVSGYRFANKRNRFQQVQSGIAFYVDADKPAMQLYFSPDSPAK